MAISQNGEETITNIHPLQPPAANDRTYALRLAMEMFKNLKTTSICRAHGASTLYCEVVNPHDNKVYEVVIIPPKDESV